VGVFAQAFALAFGRRLQDDAGGGCERNEQIRRVGRRRTAWVGFANPANTQAPAQASGRQTTYKNEYITTKITNP
jgi:hypothetical protein